jgi:hypothetical protein
MGPEANVLHSAVRIIIIIIINNNNNNNNNNKLQMGSRPVAVVIIHVHEYELRI